MAPDLLVRLLAAAARLQNVDGRALPLVAELLVAEGIDVPSVVRLSSLDTEPFDPRDAREIARAALAELGVAEPTAPEAANFAGALLGLALHASRISPRVVSRAASRLVVTAGYDVADPLLALYGLDDAWDAGWAGSNDKIETQVRAAAEALMDAEPEVVSSPLTDREWSIVEEVFALRRHAKAPPTAHGAHQ